jgi:endo-1,4-beta-xylanase
MVWVDPDRSEPEGMKYQTFHSKTIDGEVSYLIYLPPDYEQQTTTRYPVVYQLHGSGGMPSGGAEIARRLDKAIRAGRAAPDSRLRPRHPTAGLQEDRMTQSW